MKTNKELHCTVINAYVRNGCCSVCIRCEVLNHQNWYRVGTATVTHARIITTDRRYVLVVDVDARCHLLLNIT